MLTKIFAMLYPVTLTLLRIFAGFLFWERGASKLLGWFGGNQADFFSLLWIAAILEFLGGIAIVAGLFTRPVAFILAGEMAVAFFTVHFPGSFWPIVNPGQLARRSRNIGFSSAPRRAAETSTTSLKGQACRRMWTGCRPMAAASTSGFGHAFQAPGSMPITATPVPATRVEAMGAIPRRK